MSEHPLDPGARTAIEVCLGVTEADRVLIITDRARLAIGEALQRAALQQAAPVRLESMESHAKRPFTDLPESLAAALREFDPTVTVLATTARRGEIRFRLPLARFLRNDLAVRHGHMIGITEALMTSAMCADYERVASLTHEVTRRMREASVATITSPLGTALEVHFDNERLRWMAYHGLYHQPGEWGNLPEGESCTSPLTVDGTFAALLVGDYFTRRYGVLESPVRFQIESGQLVAVDHEREELATELWAYLGAAENGRRVGEFGIGTNESLRGLVGNLLADEKVPGVHLAFGHPLPDVTGATWSSSIHVDVIDPTCTIDVDGLRLMEGGSFLI